MKSTLLLAATILLTSHLFGTAPATIAGSVYYETDRYNPPRSGGLGGVAGDASVFAVVLNNDGTFTGLFTQSLTSTPRATASQVDGTYSYQKIDDQTGELTLSGIPLRGGTGGAKRTLQFTSDNAGTITPEIVFNYAEFRIAPLTGRAPLSNCSNRSFVNAGGSAFTGFVITSGGSGFVLVRAVGPGLAAFGITDPLQNPRLSVPYSGSNNDWTSESAQAISRTGAIVGAFPLAQNSKDAAAIIYVPPGAYVAQVSSTNTTDSGQVLIEVYVLP